MIRVRRGAGFTLLEVLIRLVVVFLIGLAAFLIGRGAGGGVGVVPPSDGTWVERTMIWNLPWEQWLHPTGSDPRGLLADDQDVTFFVGSRTLTAKGGLIKNPQQPFDPVASATVTVTLAGPSVMVSGAGGTPSQNYTAVTDASGKIPVHFVRNHASRGENQITVTPRFLSGKQGTDQTCKFEVKF